MALRLHRKRLSCAGRHRHIEVNGISGDSLDQALGAPEGSAYDAGFRSIVLADLGNVRGLYLLITGCRHLERRGEICPQLESVHSPLVVAFWHLLMQDAS